MCTFVRSYSSLFPSDLMRTLQLLLDPLFVPNQKRIVPPWFSPTLFSYIFRNQRTWSLPFSCDFVYERFLCKNISLDLPDQLIFLFILSFSIMCVWKKIVFPKFYARLTACTYRQTVNMSPCTLCSARELNESCFKSAHLSLVSPHVLTISFKLPVKDISCLFLF